MKVYLCGPINGCSDEERKDMTPKEYATLYHRELHKAGRGDTGGVFKGAHEAAIAAVVNAALEEAAQVAEASQSGHRGSGPDAARRNVAILIRDHKRDTDAVYEEYSGRNAE